MGRPHGSGLPQREKSATPSSETERNVWCASCSATESRPRDWMSSLFHAANSLMPPTPLSNVNTPHSSSAPQPRAGQLGEHPGAAARVALLLIRGYKYFISPALPAACRFVPSCADYTAEAIMRHGLLKGGWLGVRRLSRCHPLGGHGHDPVPLN
jgi:uncharacterized protein